MQARYHIKSLNVVNYIQKEKSCMTSITVSKVFLIKFQCMFLRQRISKLGRKENFNQIEYARNLQ